MRQDIFSILLLTLQTASVATICVMIPAVLLGYTLARYDFRGKEIVSAIVGLPLVLPPTAVGFLLLRLFAFDGPLGRQTLGFDLHMLLNWKAAVLAAAVMSFPLVVRTARVTFEGINPRLEMMAKTLGHSPFATFFLYTLPLATSAVSPCFRWWLSCLSCMSTTPLICFWANFYTMFRVSVFSKFSFMYTRKHELCIRQL